MACSLDILPGGQYVNIDDRTSSRTHDRWAGNDSVGNRENAMAATGKREIAIEYCVS
jgi:hypothetical protein